MSKQRFFSSRYLLTSLLVLILVTTLFAIVKILFPSNTQIVYVTAKLSQGYWWVPTNPPKSWYLNNIHLHDKQYNFQGQPIAEIIALHRYPLTNSQNNMLGYNIYLTLKLHASYNSKTNTYYFNHNKLLVGAPIDLDFSSFTLSATITSISPQPPQPHYQEKIITLTKSYAYPWEYQAIKIGDTMTDGQHTIFQVLDKSFYPTTAFPQNHNKQFIPSTSHPLYNIVIKAKVFLHQDNNQLIFAQEYPLTTNISLPIITPHYNYSDFIVSHIE